MPPSHQAAAGPSAAPQPSAQPTAPTRAPPPRAQGTQASKAKRKDKARDMSPASALRRGMTPPPQLSYWKESPKDWAKDAEGVIAMSSTELIIAWCKDRSNRDNILGKKSDYTLKKAIPELQRYMFERNGPTLRSRASITKKFKDTKNTFKRLYVAINETGNRNGKTVKWDRRKVVLHSREEIDAFCNKIVPFYDKWESILAETVGIADPSIFAGSDEPSGARDLTRSRAMGGRHPPAGLDKDKMHEFASMLEDDDEPEDVSRLGMPVEDEADGLASESLRSVSPPPPLPTHQRPPPSASPSAGDAHRSKRSKGRHPALDHRSQVAKQKAAVHGAQQNNNTMADEERFNIEDTIRIDGDRERREAERDSREMKRDEREVNRDEAARKFNTELIQIHRSAAADKKEIAMKQMAVEVWKHEGGSLEEAMRKVKELN